MTSLDAGTATIVRHQPRRAESAVREAVESAKGQVTPPFGSTIFMKARGGVKGFRPWYKRYCCLDESGVSWYREEPTPGERSNVLGRIPLHLFITAEALTDKGADRFIIKYKQPRGGSLELVHLRCETAAEMHRWLELIARRLNERHDDIGFGATADDAPSLPVATAPVASTRTGKVKVGATNYRPAGKAETRAGPSASVPGSSTENPDAQIGDAVEARITAIPGNSVCADCATSDAEKFPSQPTWGSTNLGVVFCIRCSGVHRKMGAHITKVLSLQIDSWSETQLLHMEQLGNAKVNAELEACLPPGVTKPDPAVNSMNETEAYIRAKYELGSFKQGGDGRLPVVAQAKDATKAMDAFCGLLIVRLLRGSGLPNLDLLGRTDPFVEVHLSERKQRSKTIKNSLNPVWNEILSLNVRSLTETLVVKVFDEDRFSNTFVGQAVVPLDDLTHDGEPMGFHLTLTGGKCVEGQSHIAVELTYNPLGN